MEASTVEAYESSVANVVVPACGELLLADMTVLRCNRILQRIRGNESMSPRAQVRSVLSQVCLTGIEHGILDLNRIRDNHVLLLLPKQESVLTPT